MFFASDNAGPVHPQVMRALNDANTGYRSGYGADAEMDQVRAKLREVFEAPDAAIYLVATGTTANSLALATLTQPWQTVFCTPHAHIENDECNAPEFFMGGAKLTLVGHGDKMRPDALEAAITNRPKGVVHSAQPGSLSITQATEMGHVYSLAEIRALTDIAHAHGMKTHLDGARFTNALVSLGCSAADMTWRAGIDAVSFGGTKNGLMGVEAVVLFDPSLAWEFELRRKRAGHLFSKHRYLSAQMVGYLENNLWLDMARAANGNAAHLAAGLAGHPQIELLNGAEANMIFARLPRGLHRKLIAAGAKYYLWTGAEDGPDDELVTARFVCDWSIPTAEIDKFIALTKS